jgi:integrase/recombinase XerD
MTALPPLLQAFFTERLARQRDASPHTIASYRDSFRLLLTFLNGQTGKAPSKLQLEDLDPARITSFLSHLENERGNSVRTRNARLAAIHSFFHYAALKAPESSEQIARVLSIPEKRFDATLISYLTEPEIDALLAAPDRSTRTGRRDHALLLLAVQTGLRASELASLRGQDLNLGAGWVRCEGKGRKERCTRLTRAARQVLRVWLRELGGDPASPLFPSRNGGHLTRSAIWRLVVKHTSTARARCPSLAGKNITPHTLRHYVDGRVMWPAGVFPVAGGARGPVPAT